MTKHLRALPAALAILAAAPATAGAAGGGAPVADPASLVNPIVGTSGAVDTFPGPDMPFGMIQWSPDTAPARPDGGGYEYTASQIRGFSLTHISGPGCGAVRRRADPAHHRRRPRRPVRRDRAVLARRRGRAGRLLQGHRRAA